MRRPILLVAGGLLASAAGAFLVSNSPLGGGFVFEQLPVTLQPADFLVDTESVPNVGDAATTTAIAQELMDQWNGIAEATNVFGVASQGGPYNGTNVGQTFGLFTDAQFEVAFDDDGSIFIFFGLSPGVLGITLKSVDIGSGNILDMLVVVNTSGPALSPAQDAEDLFRGTLLHEFGHGVGLGHTAVGMSNTGTFGFCLATPQQMPTMFPFRFPVQPEEGATLEGDDAAGFTQIYPGDTSGVGSISGTVRGLSGAGANAIAVRAVGPSGQAEQHIGVLTNEDGTEGGTFRIPNLPVGGYKLIVEPVNGRGSVTGGSLGTNGSLGADPFLYAIDEHWQPGDTYDPAVDDPAANVNIQVRGGRDTGSVHVVLNGQPFTGPAINGSLSAGDTQVPDAQNGFHFADYFLFQGSAGQQVTFDVDALGFVPQLCLLRPSDLMEEFTFQPAIGFSIAPNHTLAQNGIYTLILYARATTGNAGGQGAYTMDVVGVNAALPPVPVVTGPAATAGPADPGAQQFGGPLCALPVLQVRFQSPSHEELWVDQITVRASGTGDDAAGISDVRLVHDLDGDGQWNGFEPVLANGTYNVDNGNVVFANLGLEFDAGDVNDLLVLYDTPLPQPAGFPFPWILVALLPLVFLRRRAWALVVLLVAVGPLACGGGGGGNGCNGPFDATGVITTFEARIVQNDIVAFTSTSQNPENLPANDIMSGTLSVSN